MRTQLSHKHIRGSGIEIGALHFPCPVLPGVKVTYIDRGTPEEIAKTHGDINLKSLTPAVQKWIIDNGETLTTIPTASQDFVIANHVLEHCENVFGTLLTWCRVLKSDGVIFAAIPDKRHTFDQRRAITPISHLIDESQSADAINSNLEAHYRDWFTNSLTEGTGDIEAKVKGAMAVRANIHFHVWDKAAIDEMLHCFAERHASVYCVGVETHQNGSEVIAIIRKR